jgi:hypothetical protein
MRLRSNYMKDHDGHQGKVRALTSLLRPPKETSLDGAWTVFGPLRGARLGG